MNKVKDSKEIENCIAKRTAISLSNNVRLFHTNRPKFSNSLAQITVPADLMLNVESTASSEI